MKIDVIIKTAREIELEKQVAELEKQNRELINLVESLVKK